jgi:K+ transporter
MKEALDYQPPQIRRRFNPQFAVEFVLMVGAVAITIFGAIFILVCCTID